MATEKQSKEKEQYDARTFAEIYNSLNPLLQGELRCEIMRCTGASRATVFFWRKGLKIPKRLKDRQAVSDCLRRIVGIKAPQHLLFDIKR